MSNKISIRFYKDHKVRAILDEKQNRWNRGLSPVPPSFLPLPRRK